MKKEIIISIIALFLITGSAYAYDVVNNYYFNDENKEIVKNDETLGNQVIDRIDVSLTELTGVGSSTSVIFSTKNADKVALNLDLTTASSVSELDWIVYFSEDASNWFSQDDYADTSSVVDTHGATALTHKWTPGTATESYKRIVYTDILSSYMKVEFTAVGATSSIAMDIITQQTQ